MNVCGFGFGFGFAKILTHDWLIAVPFVEEGDGIYCPKRKVVKCPKMDRKRWKNGCKSIEKLKGWRKHTSINIIIIFSSKIRFFF